jgi:hypothetical protein
MYVYPPVFLYQLPAPATIFDEAQDNLVEKENMLVTKLKLNKLVENGSNILGH